jgi:hypothetical protein
MIRQRRVVDVRGFGGSEDQSVIQTPNLPAIRALRPAWNKGRIVGQKRPLKPKHVWAIRIRLEMAENHRDWRCSIWQPTASCVAVIWSE